MGFPRITDSNRRWWVLATMAGSLSMIMIDQTVVSVALPTMERDLGLSQVAAQWVVNAYMLTLAMFVAIGGRLGDLFGPERLFRAGAALFVAASALCGLAQGEAWIIGARALQGVGAAVMVPATGAILINAFGPHERGKAMGIYSGSSMVFLALGPLVGGVLTQAISWRAVFFVNLPIGLITLAAAHLTIARSRPSAERSGSLDWAGSTMLVAALGALVLALMQGQTWGWTSPIVIALLAGAVVLVPLFVWWEHRSDDPLIRITLLRKGNFAIDNGILAAVQFALVGISVFGAIWVQTALGFDPIKAGLSLLPLTLPLLFAAPLAGRVYDRVGARGLLSAGTLLLGLSIAWLALGLHHLSYPWIVPGYVGVGLALGLTISPASTDALNIAATAERSEASGITQMTRQVGGSIGLAVLGAIIAGAQSPAAHTAHAARTALTNGTADAYWVAAALMTAVALAAFVFVRHTTASDAEPASRRRAEIETAEPHPAAA